MKCCFMKLCVACHGYLFFFFFSTLWMSSVKFEINYFPPHSISDCLIVNTSVIASVLLATIKRTLRIAVICFCLSAMIKADYFPPNEALVPKLLFYFVVYYSSCSFSYSFISTLNIII